MAEKKKKRPARSQRRRKPAAPKGAAPARRSGRETGGRAARLLRRKRAPEPVTVPAVEARALARYVRMSPQKARLVIDRIRGQDAGTALHTLRLTNKRAALPIAKVLRSAIANAEQKSETVDVDHLYVKHAVVNPGPRLKRIRPAAYGRAFLYQRRMSHIEIAVAERKPAAAPAVPGEAPAPLSPRGGPESQPEPEKAETGKPEPGSEATS